MAIPIASEWVNAAKLKVTRRELCCSFCNLFVSCIEIVVIFVLFNFFLAFFWFIPHRSVTLKNAVKRVVSFKCWGPEGLSHSLDTSPVFSLASPCLWPWQKRIFAASVGVCFTADTLSGRPSHLHIILRGLTRHVYIHIWVYVYESARSA